MVADGAKSQNCSAQLSYNISWGLPKTAENERGIIENFSSLANQIETDVPASCSTLRNAKELSCRRRTNHIIGVHNRCHSSKLGKLSAGHAYAMNGPQHRDKFDFYLGTVRDFPTRRSESEMYVKHPAYVSSKHTCCSACFRYNIIIILGGNKCVSERLMSLAGRGQS